MARAKPSILLDENLSPRLAAPLRPYCAGVQHIHTVLPRSAPDGDVWAAAQRLGRVLATCDHGFLPRAAFAPHTGLLLISVKRQSLPLFEKAILRALQRYPRAATWADATVEVREATVRRVVAAF